MEVEKEVKSSEENESEENRDENESDNDDSDEDNDNNNNNNIDNDKASDPLKCRMYENAYPRTGDLVVVEVKKIVDMGAYCNLLEYNNLEGMLLMTELQRRRIRSVKRVIKEGRQEIVQVLRVNKEKHFIDLSKKRVDAEEIPKVEERWNKSKVAHSIIRQVAVLSDKKYSMKDLYKMFGWKLSKDFGSLFDAFKYAMTNWEDVIVNKYPNLIPNELHAFLKSNIEKRLKPQMVTIRGKIKITCFTIEGVNAIKKALKEGLKFNNNEFEIKIKLIAPPLFTVSVSTFNSEKGIEFVNQSIVAIKKSILECNGSFELDQKPKIITMDEHNANNELNDVI